MKKYKLGFWNKETQKICSKNATITNKKYKLGFFNPEVQSSGGQASSNILRKNLGYLWKGVKFRSKAEMECAKKLLTKPILGVNCNIKVGTKTIDFYPQKNDKMFIGFFVEYHPILIHFHPKETHKKYYNARRKILNENGYKNKKLIVIKSLNELK